jgi:hypothetical protein
MTATKRRSRTRERITVLTFALAVLLAIVGIAFAAGYILGKLLL